MNYLYKNEVVDYDFFNNKSNDTILFLHGWGGNKFSFSETINLLKSQFNILTITLPTINPTISVWNMFDYVSLVENLINLHSIKNPIVVCHSFGCRITMLLNKKIVIKKIVITGGAGIKKSNIFIKIIKNNNKIILKSGKFKDFYKLIASKDYVSLSQINKKTFQNVINLNLKFCSKFPCPTMLFWGKIDKDTPLWIAKQLKKNNNAKLITTNSNHFAYINESSKFNHEVLKFLKNK